MYGIDMLARSILLLAVLVIIGMLLKRTKIIDSTSTKNLGNLVIYLTQPAMILYSFISVDFTLGIVYNAAIVFVMAVLFHFFYYFIAKLMFKSAPEKKRSVLRFSMVFTNAGFLGIPLISSLLGDEAAVYATFYVVCFNIFCWSIGCFIYTNDKKYISIKQMLINPATVPTYIGILFAILASVITLPDALKPAVEGFILPFIRDDLLYMLKATVLPVSMIMVGIRLADCKIKELFNDKYMWPNMIVRLLVIPMCVLLVMKGISLLHIFSDDTIKIVSSVLVISASTPTAAMTTIFAEKFDSDPVYASKYVSASTLLSLFTMIIMSTLLKYVM
ncbi:MAG: AEC family transporter [Acutalibacteraceae bacterium]|nr:AEC family transporter [Acutalibacteraceae bacterium]